jgi:hypothetical protein
MRDHTKLRAFELADEVALMIYQVIQLSHVYCAEFL